MEEEPFGVFGEGFAAEFVDDFLGFGDEVVAEFSVVAFVGFPGGVGESGEAAGGELEEFAGGVVAVGVLGVELFFAPGDEECSEEDGEADDEDVWDVGGGVAAVAGVEEGTEDEEGEGDGGGEERDVGEAGFILVGLVAESEADENEDAADAYSCDGVGGEVLATTVGMTAFEVGDEKGGGSSGEEGERGKAEDMLLAGAGSGTGVFVVLEGEDEGAAGGGNGGEKEGAGAEGRGDAHALAMGEDSWNGEEDSGGEADEGGGGAEGVYAVMGGVFFFTCPVEIVGLVFDPACGEEAEAVDFLEGAEGVKLALAGFVGEEPGGDGIADPIEGAAVALEVVEGDGLGDAGGHPNELDAGSFGEGAEFEELRFGAFAVELDPVEDGGGNDDPDKDGEQPTVMGWVGDGADGVGFPFF